MKTLQQAYNRIKTQLLKQGKQSYDEDRDLCMYRGPNGLHCGIGWIITNENYKPELEAEDAVKACVKSAIRKSGYPTTKQAMRFYREAQEIHDEGLVEDWGKDLRYLAREYNLNP